jgi:hypothetical protein
VFDPPSGFVSTKIGLLRKDDDPPRFWLRLRIDQILGGGFEIVPRIEDVVLNTITATNSVTITDELIGASQGTPNQRFQLANTPVLLDRFDLQVDEGEGFRSWKMVRDFAASKRNDLHFTLSPATGEVRFGDGEQGKIPGRLTDSSDPETDQPNVKAANYRWGGGAGGNAGPGKITSPESIRSRSRAVTGEDFEFLARQTPGARIRRARALPLRHPDLEPIRPSSKSSAATLIPVPGVITVIVVPEVLKESLKPIPSADTLKLVGEWLNQHRLITTELYVAAPKYKEIEIEARVIAKPTANSGQVAEALQKMLLAYFHPLTGGNGTGWEVYRRILDTEGVARLEAGAVSTYVDGQRQPSCSDVLLDSDELVFSRKHKIIVTYA